MGTARRRDDSFASPLEDRATEPPRGRLRARAKKILLRVFDKSRLSPWPTLSVEGELFPGERLNRDETHPVKLEPFPVIRKAASNFSERRRQKRFLKRMRSEARHSVAVFQLLSLEPRLRRREIGRRRGVALTSIGLKQFAC